MRRIKSEKMYMGGGGENFPFCSLSSDGFATLEGQRACATVCGRIGFHLYKGGEYADK